ncbi:adenosylmethionine decarboxylase [candidate division WOR-3 bacterium]|nr:adenosylmethionine decarboxylase [candidate division WOR-3 bacterium]
MEIVTKKALGTHTILEFEGCPSQRLVNSGEVEQAFREAARRSNASVVDSLFHYFNPHGVSGVVVIAESHFSVHTWPEHGYAAIDFFTCSDDVDIDVAISHLKECLQPKRVRRRNISRGNFT